MDSTRVEDETVLVQPMSSLSLKVSLPSAKDAAEELPPSRSHDPQKNLKRSDPFQFGSRYLKEEDDVFEFNAWDHVETDDDYKEYAELQYAKQRESPVSEFDKSTYNRFSLAPTVTLRGCLPLHSDDLKIMHSSSEVTYP